MTNVQPQSDESAHQQLAAVHTPSNAMPLS